MLRIVGATLVVSFVGYCWLNTRRHVAAPTPTGSAQMHNASYFSPYFFSL